MIDTL